MGWQRTGYDYVPAPGEPYYPQGKPDKGEAEEGTVISSNADSKLVRTSKGDLVITDKRGGRRTS